MTGETVMLAIGTLGGVALGVMALRDKMRDYVSDHLRKDLKSLDQQLDEERADHERTRLQLRRAHDEIHRLENS